MNSSPPKNKSRSPQPKSEHHQSSSRNGHSKKEEKKSRNSESGERKSSDSKHRHSSSHSSSSSSSSKRKHDSTSDKPKDITHSSHKKPKLEEISKDSSSNSKHREHTSSSSGTSSSSKSKENLHKKKSEKRGTDDEVDGSQGMGFAEALALFDMPSTSKKHSKDLQLADKIVKVTKSTSKSSRDDKRSSSIDITKRPLKPITALTAPPKLLTQKPKLEPLPDIVLSSDVSIPEYRPSLLSSAVKDYINTSVYGNSSQSRPVKQMTDKELLTESFSSKANRTRVYSGNRVQRAVPSLFEMCIRILQENIEYLECTGGVPFDILKPVLERAKPEQLATIEYYNP